MGYTDLRLKLRHFFKKYRKIVFVVITIWGIVIMINQMLKNREVEPKTITTYEPHVSVMSQTSSTPKSMQEPIENLIKKYVDYCNERDLEKAFFLLSEECREFEFDKSPNKFIKYVLNKIPSKREYSIQNYSNIKVDDKRVYIYEIRYTEDLLATGLTETDFYYTSEKMSFYEDDYEKIQMNIGNYIYQTDIKNISENEYLKIDVIQKIVNYETEEYEVKFTNRSDYTIVIADGNGKLETELQLNQETRQRIESTVIVLEPGESKTEHMSFQKFVDDKDNSNNLIFGSIRVMEKYTRIEEIAEEITEEVAEQIFQSEIDNAIAKFSMTVSVKK